MTDQKPKKLEKNIQFYCSYESDGEDEELYAISKNKSFEQITNEVKSLKMEDYEENEEYEESDENEEYEEYEEYEKYNESDESDGYEEYLKNEEYKKYEDSDESDESDEYKENYKILKDIDPEERYFPITTNIIKDDNKIWDSVSEVTKQFQGINIPYNDKFVETVNNNIERLDIRFAALIEIGNDAYDYNEMDGFEKAGLCLKEIISTIEPNKALIGLNNYLKSYCLENSYDDEIIPDFLNCLHNRGSILNLIELVNEIKGADEELEKKVKNTCHIIIYKMQELFEKYYPNRKREKKTLKKL